MIWRVRREQGGLTVVDMPVCIGGSILGIYFFWLVHVLVSSQSPEANDLIALIPLLVVGFLSKRSAFFDTASGRIHVEAKRIFGGKYTEECFSKDVTRLIITEPKSGQNIDRGRLLIEADGKTICIVGVDICRRHRDRLEELRDEIEKWLVL